MGTVLGAVAGNILPVNLVNALGAALYGMFLAVIIPPAKKDKIIAVLIGVSFALSYAASNLDFLSKIPSGIKTIVLTVSLSACAAFLFPVKDNNGEEAADE